MNSSDSIKSASSISSLLFPFPCLFGRKYMKSGTPSLPSDILILRIRCWFHAFITSSNSSWRIPSKINLRHSWSTSSEGSNKSSSIKSLKRLIHLCRNTFSRYGNQASIHWFAIDFPNKNEQFWCDLFLHRNRWIPATAAFSVPLSALILLGTPTIFKTVSK